MRSFINHPLTNGLLVVALIFTISAGVALGEKNTGTPGSAEVDDKTKVQWKFDSSQCSVAIDVHKNANLFRQELVPGDYLTWSDNFIDSQLTVSTESDCYHGYTVSVYASNTHPNSVNVLEDFELATEKGSTYADQGSVSITLPNPDDWNSFSDTGSNNSLSLGRVEESDLHNNLNNNVDGTEWIMDYRYKMDGDDIPNNEYYVELTYVISSE